MLVLCTILRLFVNILTADDKYSLINRGNFTQPIQILLSKKQKTFSEFFSSFFKCTLNFEHFEKKDNPHSRCISEITASEEDDQINVSKIPLQNTLPQTTWYTGTKTFVILMTLSLPCLLITLNIIQLEKVYVSAMQCLKTLY